VSSQQIEIATRELAVLMSDTLLCVHMSLQYLSEVKQ